MSAQALPAPGINGENRPYWEAARHGRLALPACRACGHLFFMPRSQCPRCWSDELDWRTMSGRGRIHSFSIVHRAALPAFAGRVPYVLAMVELDEGPRMMSNLIGTDALQAAIGDAVDVCFEACADGAALPQFRRRPTE
ncbi:MAG: Zn-ribbon domain-containing OB-fold protein [Burkholderiaceae bacterium]